MKNRPLPEPFVKITPGMHLRFLLEDAKMTSGTFAEKAGLPVGRIRSILSDKIAPTDEDAVAMSRVFGESPNLWRGLFGLPKVTVRQADQNVMFWTTAEKKDQIRAAAAARHVSMSAFILDAVNAALASPASPRRTRRKVAVAMA